MFDVLLQLRNIHSGYDGKTVLRGVSLTVGKGEIVTLVGPNGAGKSTTLKTVFGLLTPTEGDVLLESSAIDGLQPRRLIEEGLSYLPQGGKVFPGLTVMENLEAAGVAFLPTSQAKRRALEVLDLFPSLFKLQRRPAGILSGGERQLVSFAKALMMKPRLLLIDEPSLGLSPEATAAVLKKIREAALIGNSSVLLCEQNVAGALSITDRVYVLREGLVALEATPSIELECLRRAFFG